MNKDRKSFFILLAAIFATLTYFHALVKEIIAEKPFIDFSHYCINANLLKEGYDVWSIDKQTEERIADISREHNFDREAAGPPFHSLGYFILILPFALFPFQPAVFLWLISGHLFLFFSIWLILKLCKNRPSLEDWLLVLFLVFSFWPIQEQLHLGQPNFLILFLLSASLFLMKKERVLWAGFLLGLVVQAREYLVLIVLFFLWKRNWRILVGFILGFIFLKGIGISLFGWTKEPSYWKYIALRLVRDLHCFSINNYSPYAIIYRLGKDLLGIFVSFGTWLFVVFIFIGKAFSWTTKKDTDLLLGFSLFLVLVFLISPWIHESHYLALYIPIIISWFMLKRRNDPFLYGLFISAYILLGLRYSLVSFPKFHYGLLAVFAAGKPLGVVILFFLLGRLIRNESAIKRLPGKA